MNINSGGKGKGNVKKKEEKRLIHGNEYETT
jgi:hypothetical protein